MRLLMSLSILMMTTAANAYMCSNNTLMTSRGQVVDNLSSGSDCRRAISDLYYYGAYCNNTSMMSSRGRVISNFHSRSQCIDALAQ
jgi:hypothetical protein